MIEVRQASKTFGKKQKEFHALKNVSFDVKKGEIFGVIGLSGAGKSTLLRLLAGLETLDEGNITIDGVCLQTSTNKEKREIKKKLGIVFQGYPLFQQKTVFENVAFPLRIQHTSKAEMATRVKEVLDVVQLSEKEQAYPSQLSGGQKQRVAIARAIVTRPEILLLDELTSALDPMTTRSIVRLLKRIQQVTGVSILFITHDMTLVRSLADRMLILHQGAVVEQGTVEEIEQQATSAIAKALFEEKEIEEDEYLG